MHGLVKELVARHQPGVLLVTHDVDEAMALALADRILVMRTGRIAAAHCAPDRGNEQAARIELLAEVGVATSLERTSLERA
jgi:sulfonate transport system ATP-binding protein